MSNEIKVVITGDEKVSPALKQVEQGSKKAEGAVAGLGKKMEEGGKASHETSTRLAKVGAVSAGMSSAIDDAGQSMQALVDFQQRGKEKASALARAQSDLEQAELDGKQAAQDLKQAQEDLNQAQLDAKQGAVDAAQAQVDLKQANLDVTVAQKAYNDAVKAHGKGSVEAKQASIDLAQAQADVKQAHLDAEQATRDITQANLDEKQATQDSAQAQRDAKNAALDLKDAQRELKPPQFSQAAADLQAYSAVAAGAAGIVELLAMAYNAVSISAIRAAVSTTASRIATIAGTVATGIATAAQWLWNIALTMNPIGIVIVAIAALVAAIVWIATKTTWFQTAWKASWGFIKDAALAVAHWFSGPFVNFFKNAWNLIVKAFRSYVLAAVDMLGLLVKGAAKALGWIPGIGPKLKSAEAAFQHFRDSVNRSLGGIKDKHIDVSVDLHSSAGGKLGGPKFMASGGVASAASGKVLSGLTMVGEHGIELLDLPSGSHVRSNPDTMGMIQRALSTAGQSMQVVITGGPGTSRALVESLRAEIRYLKGNGPNAVQNALGFKQV